MSNPFSLQGKTILVTGASSGIGRATAIECSKMGAHLILCGRNEERLSETQRMLEGEGHQMHVVDLADEVQLKELATKVPSLDGLVNNAGVNNLLPLNFINREKLMQVLEVNTIAPILLTQLLVKKKKLNQGASIVFTDSISGPYVASPGNAMYSASKGAIAGFVKNAALELASKNIRVNAVCPGQIDTGLFDSRKITQEEIEQEIKKYPLKRIGKPEEVAWAMVYLLSDASSFTTGASIVVDGGFTLN